jgi:ATP-binding cassette subfamily F protein 3
MIICATNQIGKMNGADWIFKQLNCEVKAGERVGIVGRNGCGKTTLFRLLAGLESPNEGEVFISKKSRVGYLEQVQQYPEWTTVRQVLEQPFAELNAILVELRELEGELATIGSSDEKKLERTLDKYYLLQEEYDKNNGYAMESKIAMVSQGLGINSDKLNQSFSSLSGGEQTKVGLACILLQEVDLLLLDEPTNHLDLTAIEWLEGYLSNFSGAVIIISHDRYFLDGLVHKIFDIEDGELTVYHGNYSSFTEQKEERLLAEFQTYQEQQKKISKIKEAIKRLKDWANRGNNEDLHRKAKNMQKALDRMVKVKRPILDRRKINLSLEMKERSGQDVIKLNQVSKSYEGKDLFLDLQALLRFQEKVAIVGSNGTGKSTLFKIILGEIEPDKGEVTIGSGVKIGYLSQSGIEGYEDESVVEAFCDQVPLTEGDARQLLARFLFYGPAVFKKVKDLSGGEKMRLRLAQLMHQKINLLLLDEPTNHLDIDSLEVVEETLAEFKGTILAISHDRYFINKLFEQIYWLENGSLTTHLGNYDEAKKQRQR